MSLIAVKALLAPILVVLASLAGRRFGARIGGVIGGLPVVAGPILLVYALDHGRAFAASAAAATLLGMVSLMAFVIVYGNLARSRSWRVSLGAGWTAFLLLTLAFSVVKLSAVAAFAIVGAALAAAHGLLPGATGFAGADEPAPGWDLPVRAACALALVLALTAAAGRLGPQLSGLLAPFPVIGSVLAAFTHRHHGTDETLRLLRGLLLGYGGFALFCFLVAVTLTAAGTTYAFLLASAAALLCQAGTLVRSRPAPAIADAGVD